MPEDQCPYDLSDAAQKEGAEEKGPLRDPPAALYGAALVDPHEDEGHQIPYDKCKCKIFQFQVLPDKFRKK